MFVGFEIVDDNFSKFIDSQNNKRANRSDRRRDDFSLNEVRAFDAISIGFSAAENIGNVALFEPERLHIFGCYQRLMAKVATKKSTGRPKVTIDWNQVGKMLEAGATAEGVAATIGCDRDTLYNRCKTDLKSDYSAFSQEKKAKGNELLRTKQFQVAMSGDKTMLIWLGKQRLGQVDKQQTEISGTLDVSTRVIEPGE